MKMGGSLTGGSDLWKNATGRDRSGVALVGSRQERAKVLRERVRPRETMIERREG